MRFRQAASRSASSSVLQRITLSCRLKARSSTARLTSVKKVLRMSDTTSPMTVDRRERNRRAAKSGR